jgi:hypothetical protein
MSKILLAIPILLIAIFSTQSPKKSIEVKDASMTQLQQQLAPQQKNENRKLPSEHVKQALNCKSCHVCEYPTREDPCLIECPKDSMVSVYHSPNEGPEVVLINEMSDNYMGVVFSHKLHAEMSVISTGCSGCHHYNTTGPVLNCRKCHENNRIRENIAVPDLKAAYHRQCLSCHKQWSHENGCNTQCHLSKGADVEQRKQDAIKSIAGKTHPTFPEPTKMIWETNYNSGKIVTFYHDEHVKLFKLECNACHQKDNCSKCHESKVQKDLSKPVKIKRSFEDHHMPCNDCHANDGCRKCHMEKEMSPFNHVRASGWSLKGYHTQLSCERCHGADLNFTKADRNCTSCHRNFVKGSFDHKTTGLILSEGHAELECKSCHPGDNFVNEPVCTECHETEITYPAQLPGKKR